MQVLIDRASQEALSPLSEPWVAAASPIALFSALAPWFSTHSSVQTDEETAAPEDTQNLQRKAQKLLLSHILWPHQTCGVKTLSKSAPPIDGQSGGGLEALALSFGRRVAFPDSRPRSEAADQDGDVTRWNVEEGVMAREAAALLTSLPDRAGQHALKLLQAE
jgi:hypothetical protein